MVLVASPSAARCIVLPAGIAAARDRGREPAQSDRPPMAYHPQSESSAPIFLSMRARRLLGSCRLTLPSGKPNTLSISRMPVPTDASRRNENVRLGMKFLAVDFFAMIYAFVHGCQFVRTRLVLYNSEKVIGIGI